MFQKLKQWTLGATVDLGLAFCDEFVSEFYIYLSLDFSACYHWWICLLVWLLSFFILLLLFCHFFLPFLLSLVAGRVLVLQPGVRPEPQRWESRVQDIGPPETSPPNIISIGDSSPRDLHLNTKTQLHPAANKFQCWTPHTRKLARYEHNPTH